MRLLRAAATTKLSEEEIKNLLKEYSSLEAVIELGKQYNANKKLIRNPDIGNEFRAQLQKENEAMGAGAEKMGEYAIKVGKLTSEERANITKLWVAMNQGERAFNDESKKTATERTSVWNEMIQNWHKEIDDQNKEQEKKFDLSYQFTEQMKLLIDAIAAGDRNSAIAIAKRVNALKEEVEVREAIARILIKDSANAGIVPPNADSTGIKFPSFISEEANKNRLSKLAPGSATWAKGMTEKVDERRLAILREELEKRQQIIDSAKRLTWEMGEQLGLSQEELTALDDKLNFLGQIASGDFVGATITTAVSIISGFMELIPNNAAKFAAQVENLNRLLEIQQRLIEQSSLIGGGGETREDKIAILEQNKAAQEAALKKAQDYLDPNKFKLFRSERGMKKAAEDVAELTEAIKDSDYEILKAQQDFNSFLTGGLDGATIASAIRQGFESGESSAADFAAKFNEFMSTAINSALEDMSKPAWDAWATKFASSVQSGVGLDPEEIASLRADYEKNVADDKARRDAYYKVTGITPPSEGSSDKSLSGAVKGVSEETASVLAGQMNAIRIGQADISLGIRQQIFHLANMDGNIANYLPYLKEIASSLKADTLRSQGLN